MSQNGFRRHALPDPLVRSALVEVPLVLAQERCEMEVVDQQHVVEQLSPYAADEAFRDGIHIRRANRRTDHLRADALGRAVERRAELVVAIPQQDGGSFPVHGGVAQLLGRPRLRRVAGRGDMDRAPRCQVHEEERVDRAEQRSWVWMKSQTHMRSAWFFRNVAQLWPPPRLRTPRMYFWIVRLLTLIPSLSSSPRMRSAPHSRPRPAISRMRSIVSGGSGDVFRGRDRRRQNRRKPARCQRTTVSGWTMAIRATPRRQPARADEQLQPVHKVELRALAAASEDIELMAKDGVLDDQLPPRPNHIDGDACDLARRCARGELRPQPPHATKDPRPDLTDTRQTHPPLGARTR